MTIAVANISLANTFGHWINQTNVMADAMSRLVITVGGSPAVGNAVLTGNFTATTIAANTYTGSGNVAFSSAVWIFDSTSSLSIQCGVDVKSTIQFDSISNITVLGQNANTPLANFLAANANGVLGFYQILIPSSQLTDFNTANASLSNTSILIWSGSNNTNGAWVAGSIANIAFTKIANLQVGSVTSNAAFLANTTIGANTIFVNTTTGRTGVGTGTPRVTFDVNGVIYATGDIQGFQTSDAGLKEHVETINHKTAVDQLMKVRVVEFDWRDDVTSEYKSPESIGHDEGVIAQEFEVLFPKMVTTRPDGTKAVNYAKLIPHLLSAIQYLVERVNELENEL